LSIFDKAGPYSVAIAAQNSTGHRLISVAAMQLEPQPELSPIKIRLLKKQ
jgi:hypothetical protein